MQAAIQMRKGEDLLIYSVRMIPLQPEERLRAEALCRRLLADPTPMSPGFREKILPELKEKRCFNMLEPMAERVIAEGMNEVEVYKIYAQALMENGRSAASLCVLSYVMSQVKKGDAIWRDACGMVGSIHKRRFVELIERKLDTSLQATELQTALDWYRRGLSRAPGSDSTYDDLDAYLRVNIMALGWRALQDNVATFVSETEIKEIATRLLARYDGLADSASWECGIAAEASLALKKPVGSILKLVNQYCHRNDVDAFELASTLRQFRDIWQIADEGHEYSDLLGPLEAALFNRQGGAIQVGQPDFQSAIKDSEDACRPPEWFAACAERSKSVGLITTPQNLGTGFLVDAKDLNHEWESAPVFITNDHVILNDKPASMTVRFDGTNSTREHEVTQCICRSPSNAMDFAVLGLKTIPPDARCTPLAKQYAPADPAARVYVMGHPNGGATSVSLYKNTLIDVGERTLHYHAATEPGSSGSPVFNETWELVGLHHGVNTGYFPDGIEYSAQEGITLEAVRRAILDQAKLQPLPRPKPPAIAH